jgi:hypothetical protein
VFDPDVEEQRPFAVLTDVDQPRLQRVVLGIADLVLADGLGDEVLGLEWYTKRTRKKKPYPRLTSTDPLGDQGNRCKSEMPFACMDQYLLPSIQNNISLSHKITSH